MIKSLEIQNFESHEKTTIDFVNGVNVIVGLSDAGKSTIMKVLSWVNTNRPLGDSFQSNWGGTTLTKITTGEKDIITRVKSETKNEYRLNEITFKAFGTDVPDEITRALNLNEVNVQHQLDRHFLLASSPGEVAKHFNRVAHLDQIDKGTSNIKKWISKIKSNIEHETEELKKANANLLEYSHLDMFEKDIEVLENMQDQLAVKINSNDKLIRLTRDLQHVGEQIHEKSKIIKAEKLLDNILKWIEDRKIKQQQQHQLVNLVEEIKKLTNQITGQENILTAENPVLKLLDLFKRRKHLTSDSDKLQVLVDNIRDIMIKFKLAKTGLKELEREFIDVFPDVCPLCQQKVKK